MTAQEVVHLAYLLLRTACLSQLLIKPSGHFSALVSRVHILFISIWARATPEINVNREVLMRIMQHLQSASHGLHPESGNPTILV